jgi:hypothetical protein
MHSSTLWESREVSFRRLREQAFSFLERWRRELTSMSKFSSLCYTYYEGDLKGFIISL